MKTIIGFDSWTEGACYFERLVPSFRKEGYRLILIHIGSWGHDIRRPREEMIGELCVRDISYYENNDIINILEIENPSAILFMSTRSIAHMAFNRYAQYKKIPTCHMYHGLVMVQALGKTESAYKINYIRHLALLAQRVGKNINTLIPFYVKSLLKTNHSQRDWFGLVSLILSRGLGVKNKYDAYVIDARTDIGCVYTQADVEHMHRNYRIPLNRIHVVGNPDLTVFDVKEQDVGIALTRIDFSKTIIYIDTALVEAGVVFNSERDFIQHILDTRDELESRGFKFIVKLHPAHYRTDTPQVLREYGIDLCSNVDFIPKLKDAIAVIVEPSTAAVIPALLGIPVLLARYGKLSEQAYGAVLISYPRSRYLTGLSDVISLLADEQISLSADDVKKWIEINSGPMPAEDMPARAVKAVCNLIAENGGG